LCLDRKVGNTAARSRELNIALVESTQLHRISTSMKPKVCAVSGVYKKAVNAFKEPSIRCLLSLAPSCKSVLITRALPVLPVASYYVSIPTYQQPAT
jgi:hypothetical protein